MDLATGALGRLAAFLESTSTTRDRTPNATDLGVASDGLSASAAFTAGDRVTLAIDNSDGTTRGFIALDPATGDVHV